MENYAAIKGKITKNQTSEDFLVLNADDRHVQDLCRKTNANKYLFSTKEKTSTGAFLENGVIKLRYGNNEQEICPTFQLRPVMEWQVENVLAATTVAAIAGIDRQVITKSIQTFSGLEHRMEWVRSFRGVDFINDSKGTNVGSTQKSLNSFKRPIVLILGGQDKDSDFSPLSPLMKNKVKHLILLGEATPKIKKILNGSTSYEEVKTLENAVQKALSQAASGDVVLLSPACASFDMFRDYEDRGSQFRAIVNQLS